jgi:hypothetical protein
MSARPPGGTCPALAHRSLLCQSTTVCSSKRWTCRGGPSPRTRGAARGSIRPRGRRAPPCRTRHWSPRAWSRQPPQPALTDLKEPRSAGRSTVRDAALHRAPQSPAADQPRSIRSSAICEVRSGLLPGSGGPEDVDQRSPCPPAHGAQNAQIWTASVVMGIEPTPAQNGGSARVLFDVFITQRDASCRQPRSRLLTHPGGRLRVPVHSWEPSGESLSSGIRPYGAYWSVRFMRITRHPDTTRHFGRH